METFREAFRLLGKNKKSIFLFELSYRLICLAIFTPVLYGLFNLSLYLAGYRYLSTERLLPYLVSPCTIAILLLIGLGITAVSLLEMSAVIQCFHASYHDKKIRVTEMYRRGILTMRKLVFGKNFMLIIFVVIVIPLTNLTVLSGYIGSITIPQFVQEQINENQWLGLLVRIAFLMLFLFALHWSMSIHCFVLEPGNYKKACGHSRRMVTGHYLKYVISIVVWNLLVLCGVIVTAVILCGIVFVFIKTVFPSGTDYTAAVSAVRIVLTAILEIYSIFSIPLSFSYLSALYYDGCNYRGEHIACYYEKDMTKRRLGQQRVLLGAVLLAAVLGIGYLGAAKVLSPFQNQNVIGATEITAHRGDSVTAPENTIPAFEHAMEHMADCIELDVAETKDGVIVVMHDSNLKRITGENVNIWDITYDELQQYDAGVWFGKDFSGTSFPTLDEVMKLCKHRIDLNIELKPTGHEKDYEQHVLDVIYENGYEYNCVVASSDVNTLKQVKQLDDAITTIYIMPIAYGNFSHMDFAYGLSVEASSVTYSLVTQVHDKGKVVYAWTVNDEQSINRMLKLGVDSIVTDNPMAARTIQNTQDMNSVLTTSIRELFP